MKTLDRFDADGTLAEDGPVRRIDGTIAVSPGEGEQATLTLDGVVHSAGTLVRTLPDATVHTLTFGPECGHATLDDEAVDLDDLQGQRRHRGARQ